ncbi:sodium/proline symporter [Bacteroidales bacterium AH-315-I05]|nr:sodium/proline symporter [Bacteroidales bacterium AH-315-I05]
MLTTYIILALYFGILFLIGFLASKKISGAKDYFVGGKKLGYWVVAFSSRATGESAWLLLGLTGMGAMIGAQAFWVVLGEVLGVAVAWLFMAKKFKKLTDKYDSITVPDYLASRFKTTSHTLRVISATALSIFVTIYVSAQIDATGKAFVSFLQWDYFHGAIVGFLIVAVYITSGGFVAVAWSDLFQGLIMLLGLLFLPIAAYFSIENKGEIVSSLAQIDPALLNIWGDGGFSLLNLLACIGLAMIGIGFMGSPQVFVRFMSISNEDEINKGRWVAIIYTFLVTTAAVVVGMLGRYMFTEAGQNVEEILGRNAEEVLPVMVENILPLTIAGLYIAAVLSAIMSTIDSLLVVASSAVTRDFYQQIFNPQIKEENMAKISRIVTLALALFALGIALSVAKISPTRDIFWFVIFGWSGIAATFCPVIILSLFWKNYTERGAIASMITGFLCVPLFKFAIPEIAGVGRYFEKLGELPPSFFIALLAGFIISKLKPNPELGKELDFLK